MLRFAQAADGLERELSVLVRVACPPDVGNVVIAPLLRELFALHPALRVEIAPGEAVIDLTRREADLALRTVRPTQGDLVVTRLTSVRWVLVASAELARELGTLRSWHDAPWIGWGSRLAAKGPEKWLETYAKGVEPVVRSDSLMLQIAAASAGVGVTLVPLRPEAGEPPQTCTFEPVPSEREILCGPRPLTGRGTNSSWSHCARCVKCHGCERFSNYCSSAWAAEARVD